MPAFFCHACGGEQGQRLASLAVVTCTRCASVWQPHAALQCCDCGARASVSLAPWEGTLLPLCRLCRAALDQDDSA